ncbi:unknown [Dialister sp. CAG:357]|nr:unknown [Dialister sp. CAG:357]
MSFADHRTLAGNCCQVVCCCVYSLAVFSSFAYTDVDDNLFQFRNFHAILVAELFTQGISDLLSIKIM